MTSFLHSRTFEHFLNREIEGLHRLLERAEKKKPQRVEEEREKEVGAAAGD